MKVFESSHTFAYPWANVSLANWRKYCAWNTQSTHVVAVDTLSRSVDPQTGILRSERLITCRQSAPRFITALFGNTNFVREISFVDPVRQTVTLHSRNLSGSRYVSVEETVTYSPDPLDPCGKTRFEQEARITAYGGLRAICVKVEEWSVERFGANAERGRRGFGEVLERGREVLGGAGEKM